MFVVGCTSGAINFYSWLDWDLMQDNIIQDFTLDGFMCLETSTAIWSGAQVYVFDNNTGQRARNYSDHQNKIKCMISSKNEHLLHPTFEFYNKLSLSLSLSPLCGLRQSKGTQLARTESLYSAT